MNELIMPHNVGVKNVLENMKEVLALYKKVIGNYRPLLDGERYLTDKEVASIWPCIGTDSLPECGKEMRTFSGKQHFIHWKQQN